MNSRHLISIAAVALLGVAPVALADAPETPWRALAASGPVSQRDAASTDETWIAVQRGDDLAPLNLVRTGKRGRATLGRHASVLIVDPSSRLQLPADGGGDRIVQESGSVIYDVAPGRSDGFRVETPYLVAGVKGTVFGVTVSERFALVSVEEGSVEVRERDGAEPLLLRAGDALMVHTDERGDMQYLRRGSERDRSRPRDERTRQQARRQHRFLNDVADMRADRPQREREVVAERRDAAGDAPRTEVAAADPTAVKPAAFEEERSDPTDLDDGELGGGLEDDLEDPDRGGLNELETFIEAEDDLDGDAGNRSSGSSGSSGGN